MHTITKSLENIVIEGKEKGYEETKIKIILKEFLQDIILDVLYNSSECSNLIFYGGSCLRKVYDLDRFSEDLDFEYKEANLKLISSTLEEYFKSIKMKGVECKTQKSSNISRITVKFPILENIGLSKHSSEKLHVKVEINDKFSREYPVQYTSKMLKNGSVVLKHYDLSTLFACKILACLDRVYVKGKNKIYIKGRDYYDLIWFLNNVDVLPNEAKLLDVNKEYDLEKIWTLLDEKVSLVKSSDLLEDLNNLLEDSTYIKNWCSRFHEIYDSSKQQYRGRVKIS